MLGIDFRRPLGLELTSCCCIMGVLDYTRAGSLDLIYVSFYILCLYTPNWSFTSLHPLSSKIFLLFLKSIHILPTPPKVGKASERSQQVSELPRLSILFLEYEYRTRGIDSSTALL
jgi:hypothetical protein